MIKNCDGEGFAKNLDLCNYRLIKNLDLCNAFDENGIMQEEIYRKLM